MFGRGNPQSAFPSTPERKDQAKAQPLPSASFTPAGNPPSSYPQGIIGASMAGPSKATIFRKRILSRRSPKARPSRPIGASGSIPGSTVPKQPSRLGQHSYSVLDGWSDDEDGNEDHQLPPPGTHGHTAEQAPDDKQEDAHDNEEDEDMDEEAYEDVDEDESGEESEEDYDDENGDAEFVSEEAFAEEGEADHDMMAPHEDAYYDDADFEKEDENMDDFEREQRREERDAIRYKHKATDDDTMNLLMMSPEANTKAAQNAAALLRSKQSAYGPNRVLKYAEVAKDFYSRLPCSEITEPESVLIQTEELTQHLYAEGIGAKDDVEKLDETLAAAAHRLVRDIWEPYVQTLPRSNREHGATVGPGSHTPDFQKACWVATLLLRIYHTEPVKVPFGGSRLPPLPQILFQWQDEYHNPTVDQIDKIRAFRPCPAAHGLYWQAVYMSLIRGHVGNALHLLRRGDWAQVRRGGEAAYQGQALASVNHAVEEACSVLESCPAITDENWDINSSVWTVFRLRAAKAKESLIKFAEGRHRHVLAASRFGSAEYQAGRDSMTETARKAESQIPWDVYESLQSLYSIVSGEADAITAVAQDWCEATIGLCGWWNGVDNAQNTVRATSTYDTRADGEWLDRLALAFYAAANSGLHFNSAEPVEVAVSCVFEGNIEGAICLLRVWSLPVASTIAEMASLGRWLSRPEPQNLIFLDNFEADELEFLGVSNGNGSKNQDGLKDTTLILYARALGGIKRLSGPSAKAGATQSITLEGWEMAVQIVGRMDSSERSEEMVAELLQEVLEGTGPDSNDTVLKMWHLMNDLGLVNFAEEVVEKYGDILQDRTYRFGDMLWYYSLAHKADKVRHIVNGLISISLAESTTYPPEGALDEKMRQLLMERNRMLELLANMDLEAAQLLGKMLSGYATLRNFYQLRDKSGKAGSVSRRQQAAAALVSVIASANDNIRGGLYDDCRDAVVSKDFILALLGEVSVFVNQSPAVITLEQIDVITKAVEDIQTVSSRVYDAADAFFQLVTSSGHGKGSTPADLMSQNSGGNQVLKGPSLLASQLHKSVRDSGVLKGPINRLWDWRSSGVLSSRGSADLLEKLRLGIARDLATLFLEQADSVIS